MIYINGSPLNVTIFPDKTSQVWQVPQLDTPNTDNINVTWDFSHEGEFMHLAQLKALLDAKGFESTLRIKYLPYARQDKAITNESAFALTAFAYLLNALMFDEIIIHDPHSKAAIEMIYNSKAQYPVNQLNEMINSVKPTVLCYPDRGAVAKYAELPYYNIYRYVYGEKVRDQLTGKITKYELKKSGYVDMDRVLIVDDICDGGATFTLLAKELYAAGAKEVNLFVSHGIFSKGLQPLFDAGIKRIFTQDGEKVRS